MNPIQIFQVIEEALALYNELKADGTIEKVTAAAQSIEGEFAGNANLQKLLSKFGVHFPAAIAAVAPQETTPVA